MTLRTRLTRCLVHNLLLVALFVAAVISLEATTDYQRKDAPAGLVECWNPDTALITEQVGECK